VKSISYWHDSLDPGDDLTPRPALPGDRDADVAIVGAGFTGLWTAHSLLQQDPTLRVVVLEAETAGFGASGRNGGWCVGDYGGPLSSVEKTHGKGSVEAMSREMHRAVEEVGKVVASAGIDCGWHQGGAIYFATNEGQHRRVAHHVHERERFGIGDAWRLLDAKQAAAIAHVPGILGAMSTQHAAAVHPARLARGLAVEVERLGATIHEQTPVRAMEDRRLVTDQGTVRADVVVRATEGYTRTLKGQTRDMHPLGNIVIATEPLADATWAEIGFADRELFELSSLLLGYGQRTADGRIVWGGMGAPSTFNGRIPPDPIRNDRIAGLLRTSLGELFPPLRDVRITHQWSGIMGFPRDQLPGIGYDRDSGFAWAGGYGGQGVASANAGGRGLADLILGKDTPETRLPWVGHRSKRWEPEPIRWLGVHGYRALARLTDLRDRRRG
jgi:glycine/D-amino acid oxidase-like deaminating enzyme